MRAEPSPINSESAIILLADDDEGDQILTRRALDKGRFRNTLHIVMDGEEALDYLFHRGKYEDPESSPRPHLMLLDLNMPKVDGRQVLTELRADPELRMLPVIVLTTSSQEEDIVRAYELGVNSYITKPVTPGGFVEAVSAIENYWFELVILPQAGDAGP